MSMNVTTYDRYQKFRETGNIRNVPLVKIKNRSTDKYYKYEQGKSRLDLVSYQYYNNPNYGWLILQANPQLTPMEFTIPDGTVLRIPYPLEQVLMQYSNDIDNYFEINGKD